MMNAAGWQPIETAPKSTNDKSTGHYWSEVIVWNTEHNRPEICRIDETGMAWWGDWDIKVPASHWMPLPKPPEEKP